MFFIIHQMMNFILRITRNESGFFLITIQSGVWVCIIATSE